MLESYARPRVAAPLPERGALAQADAPRSRLLKPYAGEGATPPLVLKDLEDGEHVLDALGGQVVLVNFWATWCPPCVKEIPSLQRLYARLRDRGFQVLAVDVGETAETVRTFAAPFEVTFPMLIDPDGVALKDWEVHGFPTSFVVDRAGHIRFAFFGALEWDDPEVVAQIESLLAE
jgi:thiol-disulfide isomerase/thioredoxin